MRLINQAVTERSAPPPNFSRRTAVYLICLLAITCLIGATALRTHGVRPYVIQGIQRSAKAWDALRSPVNPSAKQPQISQLDRSVGEIDSMDARPQTNSSWTKSPQTTVETMLVERVTSSSMTRTFTGVIVAQQASELGFKRIGRIRTIYVDQGETTSAGHVLADLDTRSLEAEKAIARAELAAAKARLEELQNGPRTETVAAARAHVEELSSLVELAEITASRREKLAVDNAISQQEVDNARLQLSASRNRFQSQLQVLRELEAGTRSEKISAQQSVIQRLEASIHRLDVLIQESQLIAPYDAIVSKRMADVGTVVAPGGVVLRIVQQANPEAWVGLPPNVAAALTAGEPCKLSAAGTELAATIKSVLPELDPVTRTQTAIFSITSDMSPRFGDVVRFQWLAERNLEGFWLPRSALTRGVRGLWSVFVVEENSITTESETAPRWRVNRHDVEVLQIETDRILVRGTLRDGDRVVARGVHRLVEGQNVAVKPERSAL